MNRIRFNEPYLTGRELEYIEDVFRERHFYGVGKYTGKCEAIISERLGASQVLLTDSCTAALEMAALLLKDDEHCEVILPSYTFTSTGSAFLRAGFDLVFAEIDPLTLMLNVEDVRSRITDRTRAVIAVHYGGLPSQVFDLKTLCSEHGIKLVEDAAQAFDCFWHDQALGTIGDLGCFSFHETKNLHAGLSGALVIGDKDLNDRAVQIRERGTNRQEVLRGLADKYSWVEVGGSFYPTELQAAFLFAQLEHADVNKSERRMIHEGYERSLSPARAGGRLHFNDHPEGFSGNYHAFYIVLEDAALCEALRLHLVAKDIAAYIGYVPLHSSKVGRSLGNHPEGLPVTEEVASRVLRLPFHNRMTAADAEYVGRLICQHLGT